MNTSKIDWRQLSGPRVSRRTLMQLAAATGAAGFANQLEAPPYSVELYRLDVQ